MKKDIKYICIPIIVLLALSFLIGLITNSVIFSPFGIFGSIILLGAIIFTGFAMSKKPLLIIGMLVISFVAKFLIGSMNYYNLNSWKSLINGIIDWIFLNIANVLAAIYLVWNLCAIFIEKQSKQTVTTALDVPKSSDCPSLGAIDAMAQELQQTKSLLDNGVLSDEEFAAEKAKVLKKYGFAPTIIQAQIQPAAQYAQSDTLPNVEGTYKFSDILLTLSNAHYDFKNVNSDAPLISGTYVLDSKEKNVSLSKSDKSVMQLSIDENGNLATSDGNVYEKQ